jgi:DNA-binding CsgD family transcriptional regulator
MSRPHGSKNRRLRLAERDRRLIVGAERGARVAKAFGDGLGPEAFGLTIGVTARSARRALQQSIERVAAMDPDERERLLALPPPTDRQRQALALRVQGRSLREIADLLGIRVQTVHQLVERGLERMIGEELRPAEEARCLQLVRIDAMMEALWPRAMAGSCETVDKVLKIMDRQARLLGLDAPRKVDVEERIRTLALAEGEDPDLAVAEALAIVKGLR